MGKPSPGPVGHSGGRVLGKAWGRSRELKPGCPGPSHLPGFKPSSAQMLCDLEPLLNLSEPQSASLYNLGMVTGACHVEWLWTGFSQVHMCLGASRPGCTCWRAGPACPRARRPDSWGGWGQAAARPRGPAGSQQAWTGGGDCAGGEQVGLPRPASGPCWGSAERGLEAGDATCPEFVGCRRGGSHVRHHILAAPCQCLCSQLEPEKLGISRSISSGTPRRSSPL